MNEWDDAAQSRAGFIREEDALAHAASFLLGLCEQTSGTFTVRPIDANEASFGYVAHYTYSGGDIPAEGRTPSLATIALAAALTEVPSDEYVAVPPKTNPLKGTETMHRLGTRDAALQRPCVFVVQGDKIVISEEVGPEADRDFLALVTTEDRAAYIKGYRGESL